MRDRKNYNSDMEIIKRHTQQRTILDSYVENRMLVYALRGMRQR